MARRGCSKPLSTLILSRSGETPFHSRNDVQEGGGKSVDLFVMPVECVAEVGVHGQIAPYAIVHVDAGAHVAGVAEESSKGPVIRFHVEIPSAKVAGEVRIHLAVMEGHEGGAGLFRFTQERLAEVKVLLHEA